MASAPIKKKLLNLLNLMILVVRCFFDVCNSACTCDAQEHGSEEIPGGLAVGHEEFDNVVWRDSFENGRIILDNVVNTN